MARNSFYTGSVVNAVAIDTSADEAAASATAAAASASTASTQASNAATSATSAAASYDSFDDRYLGAKGSAPSTDNDSNALVDGALYWNTSSDQMFSWDGSAWLTIKPTTTNQGHINTVSGIQANVTTVAGISSDVTTVAGISSDVAAVENIAANVTSVAGNASNINSAVSNASNINSAVSNASNITAVAGNATNINAVAGIASNVTSVAGNATNINAVAGNSTNINAAGTNATNAANSATASGNSATASASSASTASTQAGIATAKAVLTAADAVATAADVVSSAANAASAAATYDGFDDRYLGSKSSAPTVDNDGNSLVVGALYYDSTGAVMKVYTASGWIATSSATLATMERFVFTATANQTIFEGNDAGGDTLAIVVGAEIVTLNGVVLEITADYTVTTARVTLTSAAAANDELNVYAFGNFEIANHYTKTVADGRFAPISIVTNATHTGDVTGATALTIGNDKVLTAMILDANVTTAKIADDAVTAAKLANSINTEIAANTAKTGITSGQASAITANTAKTGITSGQASAIIANTAKTGITSGQASAITANTAKVTNATHTGDVTGATALTIADDAVTAVKLANSINTDIATGVTANTTANAALPKAGGTMTGDLILGDDVKLEVGSESGGDLQIYHDATNSYIDEVGTGKLMLRSNNHIRLGKYTGEEMIDAIADGAVTLYHDNSAKIATSANGVTVTGGAVGTMTTDNDGSFAMSASNNFKCTPTGNFTLTFTSIAAQSGNILLVNSGGHTVAAHANTKVDANLLATVSTAGTYLLAYFSDGTNVYMTNSAIYT